MQSNFLKLYHGERSDKRNMETQKCSNSNIVLNSFVSELENMKTKVL